MNEKFPNLNSLRAIAAIGIVLSHTEIFKLKLNLAEQYWGGPSEFGRIRVTMFFVLSGFLITYSLLREKSKTQKIDLKKFYARRMIRLLPLYYLILVIRFYVFPHFELFSVPYDKMHYEQNKILYFLLQPTMIRTGTMPYLNPLWSLGSLEQFYLFWPLLILFFRNHIQLILGTILFYNIVVLGLGNVLPNGRFVNIFIIYVNAMKFNCIGIGALFAYLIFFDNEFANKIKAFLFSRTTQYVFIAALITLMAFKVKGIYFYDELYSVILGVIMINLAANPNRLFNLENKVLNYIGMVSYGMYVFHPVLIVVSIKLLSDIGLTHNFILYPAIVCSTILIAAISYHFFEMPVAEFFKRRLALRKEESIAT